MEGDLTSNMGTYSPEAGIIPRTLYRLFHTLELSRDEYSVHASFVELYNEELRDLLSNEAPQPLGGGANSAGLRMYEDKGKGVVIQGLEDTPMKDAEHGLALLRKGSQKRQIAATKCNESSSRSHSVFSLTIHIKETTSKGEDVLRTGKLNLVDLAGSENIGRSGAENKRAREAGMINQSLLTLGRVINALVEKSSHVPYRESKLTRLLQESLGGRTKTCIIATVSSERNDMDETLSTLDYALRAKSIRNRPEVNQKMTRAALIKEYVHEIERLKGDLLASREKNGIYLSPESWTLMQDEHEGAKAQVEELRRNGEVVESKMISLKEQFEQNMQLLIKRENETKSVKAEYKEKEEEMQRFMSKMNELKRAEKEERTLREAYMESEKRLHSIAADLHGVAKESRVDVEGLFAKLGE
jgi:kinesin family protein 11